MTRAGWHFRVTKSKLWKRLLCFVAVEMADVLSGCLSCRPGEEQHSWPLTMWCLGQLGGPWPTSTIEKEQVWVWVHFNWCYNVITFQLRGISFPTYLSMSLIRGLGAHQAKQMGIGSLQKTQHFPLAFPVVFTFLCSVCSHMYWQPSLLARAEVLRLDI